MSGTHLAVRITTLLLVVQLLAAGSAVAHESSTGGAGAEVRPSIERLTCADGQTSACARGEQLQVAGEALSDTRRVVFLGRRGDRDDRTAAPEASEDHRLTVTVPTEARSGPVQIVGADGNRSPARPLRVRTSVAAPRATDAPITGDFVFPIRGDHDFGQSAANEFGGGRGHKGQDMFASCGTPIVAARGGTVTKAASDGRAGNYVVITDETGRSYVYMHMLAEALVAQRDSVAAGQALGEVGETGRASGCHLHFELWTAPGWYKGGRAIDPLPELRRWAELS